MKKEHNKRTPQEKEKILLDIQRPGANAGCRKYNLAKSHFENRQSLLSFQPP